MLRVATDQDRAAIARLWRELVDHHRSLDADYRTPVGLGEALLHEIEVGLELDSRLILVADDGSGLRGFLHAEVDGETGIIHELYVVPERRGAGLGAGLVREAGTWLRAHPLRRQCVCVCVCVRVCVRVERANPDALRFWIRLGFALQEGADENPSTALHLERKLARHEPPGA